MTAAAWQHQQMLEVPLIDLRENPITQLPAQLSAVASLLGEGAILSDLLGHGMSQMDGPRTEMVVVMLLLRGGAKQTRGRERERRRVAGQLQQLQQMQRRVVLRGR